MVETRGRRRYALVLLVASFLVLLMGRWIRPVADIALTVEAPFAAVASGVASAIGDTVSGVTEGPRYRDENVVLRKQIGELLRENFLLQEAKHENAMFSRMIRYDDLNGQMELEPARVIATDVNSPSLSGSVIVNRGARDGIRPGMTVVDPSGWFVGTTTDVLTNAARVLLLTSPSSSVGAMDMKTRAQAVVTGQYASIPQFRYVPTSEHLKRGDFVVTSGDLNLYPRMILLGQIVRVHHSDVSDFQTADIQPAADFGHLELVQIVRNFAPSKPAQLLKP